RKLFRRVRLADENPPPLWHSKGGVGRGFGNPPSWILGGNAKRGVRRKNQVGAPEGPFGVAERKKSPEAGPRRRKEKIKHLSLSQSKAVAKSAERPTRKSPAYRAGLSGFLSLAESVRFRRKAILTARNRSAAFY